jgi:hypothetical protein
MGDGDGLRDGQTEPSALGLTAIQRRGPVEPIKDER